MKNSIIKTAEKAPNPCVNLSALVVDPNLSMRSNLHTMLTQCGITNITYAVNSNTAIKQLEVHQFDLILCEYDLGEGQDGQQLLEDLRHNKMISLQTIFIIVTSERTHGKVVGAAELAPSDYLLKPFTAGLLLDRIGRAVEKRAAFLPTHQQMERGHLEEAVELCKQGEKRHPKLATDFLRLRAELHISLGQAQQAEVIYKQLLQQRVIAWARLGLARTMFMQGDYVGAEKELNEILAENKNLMDAYDLLAKTHEAIGKKVQAKEILAQAVAVSPHAVRRLRKLGDVALETGDIEAAETSFKQVVTKSKYSEFKSPEDHVKLIHALVHKGDAQQAETMIRDLEKSHRDHSATAVCKAISRAMVHGLNGDTKAAADEWAKAVSEARSDVHLSMEMHLKMAKGCIEHDMDDHATEVMRSLILNAPTEKEAAKAKELLCEVGRPDLVEHADKQSREEVVHLVRIGAERARNRDYKGAVDAMMEAVFKYPKNSTVAFNAALAVLKFIENVGWDAAMHRQAKLLVDTIRDIDPQNAKLPSLSNLLKELALLEAK